MLFAGGLFATPVHATADAKGPLVEAAANEDLALSASDSEVDHAALPMPAESEPAAGAIRALASRCPLGGRYLAALMHDGPRARSPAYRGCGPPR
ncbi:hypothetical protein SAMN05428990_3006 [Pseudoxanthomonas sp. YR558]|nr:hypothetical protein SAMN05428990_3006 [Pseudoxanthomonas sp. YR558]